MYLIFRRGAFWGVEKRSTMREMEYECMCVRMWEVGGGGGVKGIERDESSKHEMGEDRDRERREGIMRGKEEENDSPYLQTTPCW